MNMKESILQDNYVDLAFERYLAFKDTETYQEAYKWDILHPLNETLQNEDISEHTVVDIARNIQRQNPKEGSFVHWSNTSDLLHYAEERPAEVSNLLHELYDSSLSLEDRIEHFHQKGKAFKATLSLGAPLFGYLLAAYDYTAYPLYKEGVFKDMKKAFQIDLKLGSVSENYQTYVEMCQIVLEHLQVKYPELNMLDIQDFFFCLSRYDKVIVESAVDYLHEMAKELHEYQVNPSLFLKKIQSLDEEALRKQREIYRGKEKIKLIRFMVLDQILQTNEITIQDLENIKDTVKVNYDTNILQAWDNFKILFQLYYYTKKEKVQEEQGKIHRAIREMEMLKDRDFVIGKVLNGFNWNQHFGGTECWLAAYETKYENHRAAPQFFLSIDENGARYGLYFGTDHPRNKEEYINKASNFDHFYEKLYSQMEEAVRKLDEEALSESTVEQIYLETESGIDTETWLELMQNRAVFQKNDLQYLEKMYEQGAEATATELASALGKHVSSFNSPVVNLAKRVQEATGVELIKREDGTVCYWCLLFNGEYLDTGQFKWKMKESLKEAIEIFLETEGESDIQPYTKEHFLSEVFIEEELYDTMANLLHYKSNLILQGPPGVGKTFVSKRLAFSLMGEKDDSRVEVVQFHQNYAYEDFVMGYRPDEQGFSLQFGIFYDFCQRALENPDKNYYFIIDEINRGNLSKIFGELFMLIEKDKRDEFVTMAYSKEPFTVPSNVYLIGTMNTADRSLAQLEVALRRRFAFVTLDPAFNEKFILYLKENGVSDEMTAHIIYTISRINQEIREDFQLGRGYEIGHSFFISLPEGMNEKLWYENIIRYEIQPLLEEYFFDRPEKAASMLEGRYHGADI
ncbi:ATPase [Bacillus freudenreichii]|nr:ATPase [Bacillus freudenreichii]